ncbi:ATPase H+ transporting accessory protein 1a precursor [Danio rerio]|uniref:ATPase H+ transporting accessory protein 1a precursor n=1 Tax=Danio rerio TaxID=7955 RepID=F1R9A7_DANRE|nr:ATPase H+ transporting accessory protein 1a precursor [Danio rerio]|eukprot:XP_001339012.3 V-type proton ATPase subunit S1 [Danio rerio]
MAAVGRVCVNARMILHVFICLFAAAKSDEQVPLVAWASDGFVLSPVNAPSAGHTVSMDELESYLNTALSATPHNLLLFLQDKLSVDDFTMYGGVFGNKQDSVFQNLEAALVPSSSLWLPSVSSSAAALVPTLLQNQIDAAPLYMNPETLAQLRLNASVAALLVFRLPYSGGADMMSTKEVLSGNDEVIGQVLSIMKAQSVPYTAVFTALWPSRVVEEASPAVQSVWSRSLLQSRRDELPAPNPPLEFKEKGSTCILMWAEKLVVSQYRSGKWERHDLTSQTFGKGVEPNLSGSSCNDTHSRLVLNYEDVLNFRSFKLLLVMNRRHYKVSARHWFTMDLVQLEYDGKKASFNGSRHIYAPSEYSYRCESVSSSYYAQLSPHSDKDNANDWQISFENFQIQGFNVAGKDFSYASDCASFFTPGIWMGLVTSLLMVLVLTYGLHMIMQLRTMDRFDDPKGPAISVPQTE